MPPAQRPSSVPSTEAAEPKVGASTNVGALAVAQLLKIESDARRAKTAAEIDALLVSEGRRLVRARQVFIVEFDSGSPRLRAATGIPSIDRSSPMARWIEDVTSRILRSSDGASRRQFQLPRHANPADALTREYPFQHVLWEPFWSNRGAAFAGALYLREVAWTETDWAITSRLAESFGHARAFLEASSNKRRHLTRRPVILVLWCVLSVGLLAIRVPMSVLAPLEIAPRDAEVVSMPQEGIVQRMLVRPSSPVHAGMPLARMVDTVQRNRAEIAEREVAVAEARVEKATSLAFTDPRGRQELGIARAELALKRAEAQYARELLAQTVINARSSGIAIFSDPKEIEGKPLATGERLMLVGRERDIELRISLPVADSIVLRPGLKVRAFLDAAPLSALEGALAHIDYQVRIDDQQIASYRLTANVSQPTQQIKLGSRGTAQILGDPVPLAVYLLRRPLIAARQWIGV